MVGAHDRGRALGVHEVFEESEAHVIAGGERTRHLRLAVDKDPVRAAQILHGEASSIVDGQPGMQTREARLVDDDVRRERAAERLRLA